ncbi:unnamed protein product [Dicrocoelium dendriticum]|nr:unnamed protein product [Dicrocoelium dendriticum]
MEGTCPVRCLFNSNHCCCSTLDDFYQPSNAVTELEQVCRRELERFRKLYNFDLETMRPIQPIDEGMSGVTFTGYDRMPWRWEQLHTSSDHVPLFYWSQTRGTSGTRLNSKISKSRPSFQRTEHWELYRVDRAALDFDKPSSFEIQAAAAMSVLPNSHWASLHCAVEFRPRDPRSAISTNRMCYVDCTTETNEKGLGIGGAPLAFG